MYQSIDIATKFAQIHKFWTPYIAAQVNNHYVKFAKLNGEFIWHQHEDEDEMFLVVRGALYLEFHEHTVQVNAGQIFVVPRGVEHKPRTGPDGADVILIEPVSTQHTGKRKTDRTVHQPEWI